MDIYKSNLFDEYYCAGNVDLWYRARHFVLNVLQLSKNFVVIPSSNTHLHLVLENTDDVMVAVARQVALIAHYPNYNESKGLNRTVITFCSSRVSVCGDQWVYPFQTELLGNLLKFCKCSYRDTSHVDEISVVKEEYKHLPLDIEFEFTNEDISAYKHRVADKKNVFLVYENDIPSLFEFLVDETKGMLVNMVYRVGQEVSNLPSNDIYNISRYKIALNTFCYKLKAENVKEKWDNCSSIDKLSSIFCSDCFETRLLSILGEIDKPLSDYLLVNYDAVIQELHKEKNFDLLVRSEHARWNVEKLVAGFRPLNAAERYSDETLFGDEKKNYRKELKKQRVHIDLCSYADLRRIDINSLKYDYLMILAIPHILSTFYKNS